MPFDVRAGAGIENLIVEVDVLDVEGDVLLGLPIDGLRQLRLRHDRQADLLDDDGVARQRGGDVLRFEGLVGEEAADGVGHGGAVDDGAVNNAVARNGLDRERRHSEALAGRLQLNSLDGAGADVEPDDDFVLTEAQASMCPRSRRLS